MDRVAVFVDAGYLFAAGSALLASGKQPRHSLKLDETKAIEVLSKLATAISNLPLLRIYWYDGTTGRLSTEQATLAHATNVKIRLGLLNSVGQQKGVDSLIVIDLIELARNQAISDAILLSGDEDIRVGVQVAQNFGVRVHLVGIHPARGTQSRTLQQEADTTHEIDKATISSFLQILPTVTPAPSTTSAPATATTAISKAAPADFATACEKVIMNILDQIPDIPRLVAALDSTSGVPKDYDGKLLARIRAELNRDLVPEEKKHSRGLFIRRARERTS